MTPTEKFEKWWGIRGDVFLSHRHYAECAWEEQQKEIARLMEAVDNLRNKKQYYLYSGNEGLSEYERELYKVVDEIRKEEG